MTFQFFYLSIAGLALSVAGFAGLVTAFRHDDGWTQAGLWRLRNIVRLSISLVLIALLPFPVFALTNDEPMAIRLTALALIALLLYDMVSAWRERGDWSDASWVRPFLVVGSLQLLLHVLTIVVASPGLLMLSLIGRLEHPMHLFYNVISSFRPPVTSDV
jgi:hypothetical protein